MLHILLTCPLNLCITDSIEGREGGGLLETISDAFSDVLDLLTSAITFLTSNPWLMIMIAAPIVLGIVAALLSIFRH